MINKRYRAVLKSILGNEWYIDIRPADSNSPQPADMRTDSNGFSLSYKGGGSEISEPLRGSECTVIMIIQNQDEADFVNDIAGEEDQSYVIELLRYDGSQFYTTYWMGYIWADAIQISHGGFPYAVSLKASDSAARFKDYKGMPYNSTRVWEIFQMLFANYSPNGTIDQNGNISLSPSGMGASQNIRLGSSYTSGQSLQGETNLFYHLSKSYCEAWVDGQTTPINSFWNRLDIVTDWLRNWGFRICLEDGYYKIIETRYQVGGSISWAEHDSQGVPTGTETTENIQINAGNLHRILDGGKFFFKRQGYQSDLKYIPSTSSSPTKVDDSRVFNVSGKNAKRFDSTFGDIWSNQLGHFEAIDDPISNVTNNIANSTTSGPTNLVNIFQNNAEWIYATPQKYFNGTVRSKTLRFVSLLVIGGEKFIPNNLTLNAASDEWSGQWLKVGDLAEVNLLSQNLDAEITNQNDINLKVQ
tara:strand:+ start:135 stop:1547 length:1413 start_codon:yes stop_codon:yes gene_type:complete